MEIVGEREIMVARDAVWAALNDPAVLTKCIPGCESMELIADDEYAVVMKVAVGPVQARFRGKVLLSEKNPPSSYKLTFEGEGGAAGFGRGVAHVELTLEDAGVTCLKYTADAQVGGKLAQLGSRLIDGTAKKMAANFFNAFENEVSDKQSVPETQVGQERSQTIKQSRRGVLGRKVFVTGVVLLILILIWGGSALT